MPGLFRGFARWINGKFTLNPFHLTQEQLERIAKKNREEIDEDPKLLPGIQQIKYRKEYDWGCVTQRIIKRKDIVSYHEILVQYYFPKYNKNKQYEWLRENGYFQEIGRNNL